MYYYNAMLLQQFLLPLITTYQSVCPQFFKMNILHGRVAMHLKYDELFNSYFTRNLLLNLTVKY